MVSYIDLVTKKILDGFVPADLSILDVMSVIVISTLLGLYIFFVYRMITKKTFYSQNFNISLVALAIITAGIIMTIQSSIVVSLGMVGALSIVRFRTAIKDPIDLVFLFWSISVGIMSGAKLEVIAIFVSVAVTLVVILLNKLPRMVKPMILVINADAEQETSDFIEDTISDFAKYANEKSRTITSGRLDLVVELQVKDGNLLVKELSQYPGISSVSLLSHDGEVTF